MTIFYTVAGLIQSRRALKVRRAFRSVTNSEDYLNIVVKRYANRWLNRVLRRPIQGWPRLGDWTLEEQAFVLTLCDFYYKKITVGDDYQPKSRGWKALKAARLHPGGPSSSAGTGMAEGGEEKVQRGRPLVTRQLLEGLRDSMPYAFVWSLVGSLALEMLYREFTPKQGSTTLMDAVEWMEMEVGPNEGGKDLSCAVRVSPGSPCLVLGKAQPPCVSIAFQENYRRHLARLRGEELEQRLHIWDLFRVRKAKDLPEKKEASAAAAAFASSIKAPADPEPAAEDILVELRPPEVARQHTERLEGDSDLALVHPLFVLWQSSVGASLRRGPLQGTSSHVVSECPCTPCSSKASP